MAGKSPIEWTEHTWNPIVGCSIVSPGCTNCYAMKMGARIEAMNAGFIAKGKKPGAPHYDGTTKIVNGNAVWTGKMALASDDVLMEPLRRKKATTYFVNSMGDLFHEDVPDEWIDKVFAVMACAGNHTFQVLTKRAERMRAYLSDLTRERIQTQAYTLSRCVQFEGRWLFDLPLRNVWLGVSAERQQEALQRIPNLIRTPAAVRFISAEPLLGPIDLTVPEIELGCGKYGFPDLDWVIVGGESGPNARYMELPWARSLRDQCAAAGVRFFFKQWGEWEPGDGDCVGQQYYKVGKKRAGRLLDGIEHNAMPERAV